MTAMNIISEVILAFLIIYFGSGFWKRYRALKIVEGILSSSSEIRTYLKNKKWILELEEEHKKDLTKDFDPNFNKEYIEKILASISNLKTVCIFMFLFSILFLILSYFVGYGALLINTFIFLWIGLLCKNEVHVLTIKICIDEGGKIHGMFRSVYDWMRNNESECYEYCKNHRLINLFNIACECKKIAVDNILPLSDNDTTKQSEEQEKINSSELQLSFCKHCGNQFTKETKFCSKCGNKIE